MKGELGIVVIGRNEEQRLSKCFESLPKGVPAIYVDSGSSDNSPSLALQRGIPLHSLDSRLPFTAARARNEGLELLLKISPSIAYVQFVDGDCELRQGWLDAGLKALKADITLAAVFGNLMERYPEHSIYNQLCQLEWKSPAGEKNRFGGIVLLRVSALQKTGGYDPRVIAGEDSELSVRLRQINFKIAKLDCQMAYHDANILYFSQWLKRTIRSGHAIAQRESFHGDSPQKDCVQEKRSTLFWGLILPIGCLGSVLSPVLPLIALSGYSLLSWKIYRYRQKAHGDSKKEAALYAAFCSLAKIPQLYGFASYHWLCKQGKSPTIIEYK